MRRLRSAGDVRCSPRATTALQCSECRRCAINDRRSDIAGRTSGGHPLPKQARPSAGMKALRYWLESSNLACMQSRDILALACGILLGQCSSTPPQITADNISPISYRSYTCPELAQTAQDLSSKASELNPAQGEKWSSVKGIFGVRTENPDSTRVAELKGQLKAIEQVKTEKRC